MNQSVIEVVFKVNAELKIGEEIRVSGNSPVLGRNDPLFSIPLITSANDYPTWFSNSLFLSGDSGGLFI